MNDTEKSSATPPASAPDAADTDNPSALVYLFESDGELARHLTLQLGYFGYRVSAFEHPSFLDMALAEGWPTAIIMDIEFPGNPLAGPEAVEKSVCLAGKKVPIIFLSARKDFDARVAAVRVGSAAFIERPTGVAIEVARLIDKLDALTSVQLREPYRVLIVEDSVFQAEFYQQALQRVGMTTKIVVDPAALLEALTEFNPELVLMDVYFPECSGTQLAQVIRQMEAYFSLPIVFLSGEENFEKQLEAMRLGGDEFLTKPITAENLIAAVMPRVQRYRLLRAMMIQDSLTGLINHSYLQQQLVYEVARAARQKAPLSFVMVDVDHFKQVNDTYGHPVGDQVLISLSRFLRQRLRKTDVIGRYGGEEFGLILTGAPGDQAHMVIDRIRADFAKVEHPRAGGEFCVSFSAGVASLESCRSAGELLLAADKSLYRAKREGRNRVILSKLQNGV